MSLLQNEIELLDQEATTSERNESWTMLRVLKSRDLKLPLILVCLLQFGQQMSGVNSIFFYLNSVLTKIGLSQDDAEYATLGTGVANVVMALISATLLSHFGRKRLFLVSSYSSIVCLVVLCISMQFEVSNQLTFL